MTVKLVGSSSGSVSLQAPATTTGGANRVITLPDAADGTMLTTTNPKAGNIIQVVQTVKTTITSTTATIPNVVDMSGMSVDITPSIANSKIEISYCFNIGSNTNSVAFIRLNRKIGSGSFTEIFIGTETTSSTGWYATNTVYTNDAYMSNVSTCFLDTPSYSVGDVITYKLTYASHNGNTIEVNGYPTVTNYSTPSNMIAREVAG